MLKNSPSRDDLREKIIQLISGDISRESISAWAFSVIDDDYICIDDPVVWKLLKCLGSVDLPTTDRDYLYEKEDFNSWLVELT